MVREYKTRYALSGLNCRGATSFTIQAQHVCGVPACDIGLKRLVEWRGASHYCKKGLRSALLRKQII